LPGRDYIQRARRGLAQAIPSRLGETTLAQASGLRLGEPSKIERGWVAVVLAQVRAPHLSKNFHFGRPPSLSKRVQQNSLLSLMQN